jgi:hypothetical protein
MAVSFGRALAVATALCVGGLACDDGGEGGKPPVEKRETLTPEPSGAPSAALGGRWSCLGNWDLEPPSGNALELVGYVRTLADPDGRDEPPSAKVEARTLEGSTLGETFSDPGKDGRVALSVPVNKAGFTGLARITHDDYVPWSFFVSRAVTRTEVNAWAFIATEDDLTERADAAGIALDAGKGVLVGAVHDCDAFGAENAIVTVRGETDAVWFVEGFEPTDSRTFTTETGRFVVPNVAPGDVEVKAYGRVEEGGDLVLLSEATVTIVADEMSSVALEVMGR